MELIFEKRKNECNEELRRTDRAIWLISAIWLVGLCLFLLFSTKPDGFGRWGCTLLCAAFFAEILWLAAYKGRRIRLELNLYTRLDNGSRYREYLVFDKLMNPENVTGVLLVPVRFLMADGGERKIYLPPQTELRLIHGANVTVENTAGIIVSCKDRDAGTEFLKEEDIETRLSVRRFLSRFALPVIAGSVVFVFAVGLIFNLFHAPKSSESIYIFFAGKVRDYSLETRSISEIADEGVKLCEISSALPADTVFPEKYRVVGLIGSNILIVPLETAEQTALAGTEFEKFCGGAELPGKLSDSLEFFVRDGKNAGVFIDGALKEKLDPYFEFEERQKYVMMVSYAGFEGQRGSEGYAVAAFIEWLLGK